MEEAGAAKEDKQPRVWRVRAVGQVQSQEGSESGPEPCSPGGTGLRRMKISEPHWRLSAWIGGSQGFQGEQGWSTVRIAEQTRCANLGL